MEKNSKLKKKTVLSAFSLFFQSGYSAILGLAANLILTILLSPKIFGIYITLLALISFLNYFSDIGLAASLIQKKEITDDDVKTTFTVQQILILSLITLGFFASGFIMKFYNLPSQGQYLYLALLISFFISSLKTIPSIYLERKIQFQKIVLTQIVENTVFYISVIVFALLGFNLQSFTFAVILRAVVGLIVIYSLSFWQPKIGISIKSLRSLLSFGLPFQMSSFLAIFKDDLIILYLGKILGFEAVGYIGWAKKWAEAPIRIIIDNIGRVLFPVLSRLQHDKEKVARLIEKILNYQTTILAPTITGFALIMFPLTTIIPKYSKWQPALPLFYIFCLSSILSSYSTPFINLFNALGKAKISFFFMVIWTISIWILTPTLTKIYGNLGFPIAQLVLASSFIFVVWKAKTLVNFSFFNSIYKQLIATVMMIFLAFLIFDLFSSPFYQLIALVLTCSSSYYLILRFLFKIDLVREIREIID